MKIESLVHRLGISSVYYGYYYLVYAIRLVLKDENYLLYITKRLYPDIAKYFNVSYFKVERSIRTAITICWNEGNRDFLNTIAGYELKRKPTAGEFISILAFYSKMHH